jgi:hypothetical protein
LLPLQYFLVTSVVRLPSQCWVRRLRMPTAIAVCFDKCGTSAVVVFDQACMNALFYHRVR